MFKLTSDNSREPTMDMNPLKRKREELELRKMETDMNLTCVDRFEALCTNPTMDETAKQVFKRAILNSVQKADDKDCMINELLAKVQEKDTLIKELTKNNQVDKNKQLAAALKQIEEKDRVISAAFAQCKEKQNEIAELASAKGITKIIQRDSFTISDFLGDREVKNKAEFSRAIMGKFKLDHPKHHTLYRNGAIYFYACDRPIIEKLVHSELMLRDEREKWEKEQGLLEGPSGPADNCVPSA